VLPKRGLQGPLHERLPITPATCRPVAKEDRTAGFLYQYSPGYHVPQACAADDRPLKSAPRGIGQLIGNTARCPTIPLQNLCPAAHTVLPQSPERHAREARASRDLSPGYLYRYIIAVRSPALMRPKDCPCWSLPGDSDDPEHRHTPKAQSHRDGKRRQTSREIRRAVERIEKPDIVGAGIDRVFRFLANNAMLGKRLRQRRPQQFFGTPVRLGDRGLLAFFFKFDVERLTKILQQHRPCLAHCLYTYGLCLN